MTEIDTESIDVPEPEIPLKRGNAATFNELEKNGVKAELPCGECGTPTVVTVPPEAKDDENQKTLCRECMVVHLRDSGLL